MAEANKGLTVTRDGNTIKYGIDADRLVENINGATTKITNVNGDNIDLSKNSSITNITKSDGLLSKKADKNADNIGYSERTAWAGKLGTGKITLTVQDKNHKDQFQEIGITDVARKSDFDSYKNSNNTDITNLEAGFKVSDGTNESSITLDAADSQVLTFTHDDNLTSKV